MNGELDTFKCVRCGACCEWEGYVRISEEETESIASFLGLDVLEFTRDYTRLTDDRRSLSLNEKEDGSCVFYEKNPPRCLINEVKPAQCVDFPMKWNFPGWEKRCEGSKNQLTLGVEL